MTLTPLHTAPTSIVARRFAEREHRALTAVRSADSHGTSSSADDGLGNSLSDSKCDADSDTGLHEPLAEDRRQLFIVTNPTVDEQTPFDNSSVKEGFKLLIC